MSATLKLIQTTYDVDAGLNATKPACAGPGVHSWPGIEAIRRASRSRLRMPLPIAATHRFDSLSNVDHRIGGPSHEWCI
ncbi:hypothetical protein PG989_013467 [Apiospora arundinis]